MRFKLQKKFTNKNLDEFIDAIYRELKSSSFDKLIFDLSDVEYIGHQELLVLSALFKSMAESKVKFRVLFFEPGVEPNDRVKRQIIQIWEFWKIWKTVPVHESRDYFGIDWKSVERFKHELNYNPKLPEIYNRNGVTPFVALDYINNYSEIEVQQLINPIYRLNAVIENLLAKDNCSHPFTSFSLSTIITEELYLNFLDHSLKSSFPDFPLMAFMSISFHRKLDEETKTRKEIQNIKKLNFQTESLKEALHFFYEKEKRQYKNNSYIEFSFLDFGQGIANTLKEQFLNENKSPNAETLDSDILRYAFNHNSSRHPIYQENNKAEQFIPRGLFDALTIVRRYKGLMIVRSNFGKILFDFSVERDVDKAFSYFGDSDLFFPGTLISLYIPAIEDYSQIDVSSIKPEVVFAKIKPQNRKYLNINTIIEKLNVHKEDLYSHLLQELRQEIYDPKDHSLVFISFKGCNVDKRIIKKTIYFLLTDYEINHRNNVVILNSPPENIIEDIASEILSLSTAFRNYKLHPLPIIDVDKDSNDLNVRWLGIYDDMDKERLNDLLYEDYSIAMSDFNDPTNVSGHLNAFDSYGNLISNFPNRTNIIKFYRVEAETITAKQIEALIEKYNCIKTDDESLYLCAGNYYQNAYVELHSLVNDKTDCNIISKLLYDKLEFEIANHAEYKLIGITTTSHKILKSLEAQNLISKSNYVSIDVYNSIEDELNEEEIDPAKKYILICDVLSTGFLAQKLNARLKQLGTSVEYIVVVTSVLDPEFKTTESFFKEYKDKIFCLYQYPINKLTRSMLGNEILSKKIIRINPHTNIPIRLSINETNFSESIISHTSINYFKQQNEITIENKFLDSISNDAIRIGFLKYNNVIHPYFFKTEIILQELKEDFLKGIFSTMGKSELNTETVRVFYPRKSGIDFFNFSQLKSVLKNQGIEEIEIERFGTPEGWRFPHNADYLSEKVENNICLILDDGSCSGDSLIQMIDEISFYDAKEIVLLCIIGRVTDHKREFFSRISSIKVKNKKLIPISIYFLCHWHIPTYPLDENPNIKETVWLNGIINLQNTPQSIKKIAKNIVKEIKPKSDAAFKDHKYLPKTKDTGEIPKKELVLVRDELGKVIGYRLYRESFLFFDSLIKKYETRVRSEERYKEIELLCATFIYEPYLYEKIVDVLPDIVEKIEEFVRVLVSNEKIYESLTYKWDKKDIIHLFFIVFKNEKLIQELTIERFKWLIEFTKEVNSTTNYILYKLLQYFPLTTDQFPEKKFDEKIKVLIGKLNDEESIPNQEVRKFYHFIASLPSRKDFNSQLSLLKESYAKQKEPEYHDEKKSFNHIVSDLIAVIREIIADIESNRPLQPPKINAIRKCWFKILDFINPILSFSSSFVEFLLPYTFRELAEQAKSLRESVGLIEDIILSSNESIYDVEKLKAINKHVLKIQVDFELNSTFHQVIEDHQSGLIEFISSLKAALDSSFKIVEHGELPATGKNVINIPHIYMKKLLVAELSMNMNKYSKKDDSVLVELTYIPVNAELFRLQIVNEEMKVNDQISNFEGTKSLMLLSTSELFGFNYEYKKLGERFIQTLTFRLN